MNFRMTIDARGIRATGPDAHAALAGVLPDEALRYARTRAEAGSPWATAVQRELVRRAEQRQPRHQEN